jgi:hypothetical protein
VYHRFGGFVSINEHYEAVLADLEQTKADAEAGIKAIKRLISRGSGLTREISTGLVDPVPLTEAEQAVSVPQRVLLFLAARMGQSFTTEEIGDGTGVTQIQTLRGALGRLYKAKKIGKYGRGRYRARRANESETQP